MRRRPALVIAVVAIALLAAAFWWLDFRAAQAGTETRSQLTTLSTSMPVAAVDRAREGLLIHVTGDGTLDRAMARQLLAQLQTDLVFPHLALVDALPEVAGAPLLLVEVAERDITWTPVYARSNLTIKVAYATNGDLSWREQESVGLSNEQPAVLIKGEFQVSDSTRGIVSRHSYHRQLGEYAANEISKAVSDAIRRHVVSTPANP